VLAYMTRALAQAIAVLMAVALIAFSMFRYVGDPVANMVGPETTKEEIRDLRERLGLNDPLPVQFARFLTNAAQGEFGISYRQGRRVSTLIAERLPATLELALLSALFATVFGTILGIYTAVRRDGWLSHVFMTVSLVGVSLPTFLIGIGLIYLFAVELRWLPSFGRGEVVKLGWWTTGLLTESGRKSLVLPVLTLGFFQLTLIMRLVRAQMLETFRTDYVKFGRARGLPEWRINFKHALANAMIPVVTIIGLQLGAVIAFAIITESVFQWPGLGAMFVQAVQFVDIPVMAAYLLFVGLVFVATNLLVDLFYVVLDPRLRGGGTTTR
jgi:peptide/nickel transport system permease protein